MLVRVAYCGALCVGILCLLGDAFASSCFCIIGML